MLPRLIFPGNEQVKCTAGAHVFNSSFKVMMREELAAHDPNTDLLTLVKNLLSAFAEPAK